MSTLVASALSDERLREMRAAAKEEAGDFIDPVLFRATQRPFLSAPAAWLDRVVGRVVLNRRNEPFWVWVLALRATEADADHLASRAVEERAAATQRREEEATVVAAGRAAEWAAWAALRDRLPVKVFVGHNWTIGHHPDYVTGRDHIVVQADLTAGRLHRPARTALCETPSKQTSGRPGYHRNPLANLEREPSEQTRLDKERLPTCRACLATASRVANRMEQQ